MVPMTPFSRDPILLDAAAAAACVAGRPATALERMTVCAVVPARDEAPCIAAVVHGLLAQRTAAGERLVDEVLVADNGSSDSTAAVALAAGARVISVPQRGYGQACWQGVQSSDCEVLLFIDGDGAANPDEAGRVLVGIARGADLVIGVRERVEPGAMSLTQRFGNRLACVLMQRIWRMPTQDLGPYRAIRRDAFDALDLRDRSFGWTVEMQVRAHVLGLQVLEVPVTWHARRAGVSKISGTLRGVFGAGFGILGMIARLWWRERERQSQSPSQNQSQKRIRPLPTDPAKPVAKA